MDNAFVIQNGLIVNGDTELSGGLYVSGSITGSHAYLTSSWSVTASHALTASYLIGQSQTSSYALFSESSSYSITASYVLNGGGGLISSSYQLSNGGGFAFDNTNNITVNELTASAIRNDLVSDLNIIAQHPYGISLGDIDGEKIYFQGNNNRPSLKWVDYANNRISTIGYHDAGGFYYDVDDTLVAGHRFTVSSLPYTNIVTIKASGMDIVGNLNVSAGSIYGTLFGTASYSIFAETASYVLGMPATASWAYNAITASYALTASYIDGGYY